MKKWIILALVTCLASVLIACGNTSGNNTSAKGPEPVMEVAEEDISTGALEIIASNWDFDKDVYAIKAGEPIKLTVNSTEGIHGIEIAHTTYSDIRNQTETEVIISEPGTYTILCSIPCGQGHRTMKAKLVVVG